MEIRDDERRLLDTLRESHIISDIPAEVFWFSGNDLFGIKV